MLEELVINNKEIRLASSKELFDIEKLNYRNLSIGSVDNNNFEDFFELPVNVYLSFAKN